MPARLRTVFHDAYGSHPLHLLTMAAGFALFGYIVATVKPMTLWNPHTWWQSIVVWFTAAVIAHDLLLFPIYALADHITWTRVDDAPTVIRACRHGITFGYRPSGPD